MVMSGLPEKFWRDSYRQKFKEASEGQVEVAMSAAAPRYEKALTLPVGDPNGGENLKSSLAIESASPEIQRQAKKIVGDEKDAYEAARKIVGWVGSNMKKEYGASADRATDVLHQMRGDCTEHSLLSVALLRAAGIPARRVGGRVHMATGHRTPPPSPPVWGEADPRAQTPLPPPLRRHPHPPP